MTLYHVTLPVVGLIEAPDEASAVAAMAGRVDHLAGFRYYPEVAEARTFESDPLPDGQLPDMIV